MQKLNGREIFSGIVLLIAAIALLGTQGRELISEYSDAWRTQNGTIEVSSGELVRTLHTLLLIVLGFTGSILFLKKRKAGWIISFPVLLFFSTISAYLFVTAFDIFSFDILFVVVCLLILGLLLATAFLLMPSTLKKFRVGKSTILPTLVLFMALIAVTFFL